MRTISLIFLIKNIFLGLFAIGLLFLFSACARKVPFMTSSVVPAAEGYIKLTKDDNNNYVINIDVTNLAEVKRLQPARNTYIVWMVTDQEMAKNIGQLNSSSGMLSKKLKATFKSVSSSKPTKIFITAEDDENIQYPSTQVVLSTDKF